ncbi:MAG: hypothetical protein U0470_00065 [Anaerolineae bacterium]
MSAPTVTLAFTVAAVLGSQLYSRRWTLQRPPVGVLNLWDVASIFVVILVLPFVYLALPRWAAASILFVQMTGLLYFVFEPTGVSKLRAAAAALLLTGGCVGAYLRFGGDSNAFFVFNNVVLILAVVGIANLWMRSGFKARDMALMGVGLLAFDYLFTAHTSIMPDMIEAMAEQPFMPMIAWSTPSGEGWAGWGLGDTLMAATFPLLLYKGYGLRASAPAMVVSLAAFPFVSELYGRGLYRGETFPVMVVLGPLMLIQYVVWRRHFGVERTVREFDAGVMLPRSADNFGEALESRIAIRRLDM